MKSKCNGRHAGGQIVIGIAVIVIGFLFLFDNLGWLDLDMGVRLWPLLLIVAGCLKLQQAHSRGGSLSGAILLLVGALLLLNSLDVLRIGWDVLLPAAMIGVGGLLVARSVTGRAQRHVAKAGMFAKPGDTAPAGDLPTEDTVQATAILGAYKRRMTTQAFRGGEITAIMGGCDLDLRDASFEGAVVLHVFALMGGINLKVPADWSVEIEGVPLVGGFEDSTRHARDTGKRLLVRGYVIMGGLDIRN